MSNPRPCHIGLVQMRCTTDPDRNLAAALDHVREAARRGAHVVCLPELFRSQYFCQSEDHAHFDLAEPIPGPTTEAVGRVAAEAGVVVIASLFERRAAGAYQIGKVHGWKPLTFPFFPCRPLL